MTVISKEYAEALFALATEDQKTEEILTSLELATNAIVAEPEYVEFLASPAVPFSERQAALEQAFGEMVTDHVLSLLCLLCQRGHIRELPDCLVVYRQLVLMASQVAQAEVISAVALSDEEKSAFKKQLEQRYHKHFEIEFSVDSTLLGGAVIKTDGVVIDGSLKHRLSDMKEVIYG